MTTEKKPNAIQTTTTINHSKNERATKQQQEANLTKKAIKELSNGFKVASCHTNS